MTMNRLRHPHYRCRPRRTRSGFTLVEIAVALAIFVFGALAIVRIFPPALSLVRGSERRTIAARMDSARLNIYETRQAVPPDAIYTTVQLDQFGNNACGAYPTGIALGSWCDPDATATPTLALTYTGGANSNSIPRRPQDILNKTALGNFRHIQGERHEVKQADIGGTLTTYVLTQFPWAGPLKVYKEDTIKGVRIDSNGFLNFSQARTTAGASFNDGSPRPPDTHRSSFGAPEIIGDTTYYVSYRYFADAGTSFVASQGVVDEPLRMYDNANWPAIPAPQQARVLINSNVVPGTVQVRYRQRVPVFPAPPIPPGDDRIGVVRLSDTINAGAFKPKGTLAGQTTDPAEYTAVIDYDVYDWQIMVHDEVPTLPTSTGAPNQLNLNLPVLNIEPEGTHNVNSLGPITVLFQRPPNPQPVLQWANLSNGTLTATPGPARITDINTTAGRLTLEVPTSTPTRVVYRTLDLWAHQVGVAARSYVQFLSARPVSSPREPWREYVWIPNAPAQNGVLYFQASEAGKQVIVDYTYRETATNTDRKMTGIVLPISGELVPASSVPGGFTANSTQVAVALLRDLKGNQLGQTIGKPVIGIDSVRGLSVTARTAWIENQRYTQVTTKGYRPLSQ